MVYKLMDDLKIYAALTRENEQENSWYLPCVGDQHLLHWQQLPGQMGRTRTRGGVTHQGIDSDTSLQHHHLCTKKAVLQGKNISKFEAVDSDMCLWLLLVHHGLCLHHGSVFDAHQ